MASIALILLAIATQLSLPSGATELIDAFAVRSGVEIPRLIAEHEAESHEALSPETDVLPELDGGGDADSPALSAQSVYAMDRETGKVLFEKNSDKQVPIASITKLMTALVVLDIEEDIDRVVTVPSGTPVIEGSSMELLPGEELSIRDLLHGLIIKSGNDAAMVLSEVTAGSTKNFVKMMNIKALELGMVNSHFANPTGLDQEGNYSTAFDIAQLGNFAFKNEVLATMVGRQDITIQSRDFSETVHYLQNTNKLLVEDIGIFAGKTGFTDDAGLCLVSGAERNGQQIINVVLGSEDRAEDTRKLVDWEFANYEWNAL